MFGLTLEGEALSYACIEGPVVGSGKSPQKRALLFARAPTLGTAGRDLFPTEAELFGPAVFASLPEAARAKLSSVREITRITLIEPPPTHLSTWL